METLLKTVQWIGLIIFVLALIGILIGFIKLLIDSIKTKEVNNQNIDPAREELEEELKEAYLENNSDINFLENYINMTISYEDFERLEGGYSWNKARILVSKWDTINFD